MHTENFDFSQITDSLFLGTNQCCQSHFSENLLSRGITVDISLEEERVDAPFGVESYLWLPVADHTPPAADQLVTGVAFIATTLSLRKKIYLHCKNGHGSAPTLLAAYFISIGKTANEAISLIKEKRPTIHLEEGQIAVLRNYTAFRLANTN